MSANGELFIQENLQEETKKLGLLGSQEQLVVDMGYYDIWSDKDIPLTDTVIIEDTDTGEQLGTLKYTGKVVYNDEEDNAVFLIQTVERNGVVKWSESLPEKPTGDWLQHLIPIIVDLKDGEPKLSLDDVDWLMPVLRAKIEFHEGLISEEEYIKILN